MAAVAATMDSGGRERHYFFYRPANLGSKQVPLVLALHGYTEPATDLEGTTRLNDLAATAGFEVVYPQGIQNSWNAGICCGDAVSEKIDDVAFLKALIDKLIAGGGIDARRVFVTGLSNGAFMSYRLACELPDRIDAIVSVAGTMAVTSCRPAKPISVLEMHGDADDVVPYDGGDTGFGPFPSVHAVIARWLANDQCSTAQATTTNGTVRTDLWNMCAGGTIVRLDTIAGAGHTWFGADGAANEPNATQVAWDFFSHLTARS